MRASPLHRIGDLLAIGQVVFPNDGGGTSSEAFFNDQARNLFLGLGLLLLETPALPRTIGEMLRQSSGQGRPLKDHLGGLITQRRDEGRPFSDECVDALQRLLSNSENTLSSIVATFNAPLTIFADAVVDAATSADDFRLEDLRRRRMSVYVRVPPNRLASARPLLNLFFSQLVSLNTQHLPEQDPTLKVQCLLVNDELTAMGRVGVITNAAAFLAGYNLRLLTVVQAMSQLDAVYGDKEVRTFATNHGLQILYAPREQRDADEYSAMLGPSSCRRPSCSALATAPHQHLCDEAKAVDTSVQGITAPSAVYEIGSRRFEIGSRGFADAIADAHAAHQRPRCLCLAEGVETYVARLGEGYIVKRMPDTGSHHAPDCPSYEPPAEFSGLGQVLGGAITEDPATGETTLKLDFPLAKMPGRSIKPPAGGESDSVSSSGTRLSLRGLLHYLWDQAELTRWHPGFAGKRTWATVRRHLLQAAEHMLARGDALRARLYVPEPFSIAEREAINARRLA